MIQAATANDYVDVVNLLRAVGLPTDGVQDHFSRFLVARDVAGELLGCIGWEAHGELALLRSLAVQPRARGTGLGRELVLEVLSATRGQQMREVVLLTATAAPFFIGFFGFEPVARAQYDKELFASLEWHLTQCASARCLRLPLQD